MTRADLQVLRKTVQQQAVEQLRSAIFEGVFQPGERLVETEVAALLGISRPSLREALRSLEGERLITIVPNRGPYVSVVTWIDAEQIYHVRMLIEGEAAALAAAHATKQHLDKLRRALKEFGAAVSTADRRRLVTATAEFYEVLHDSCGNRVLGEMQAHLHARISFLRNRTMSNPERPKESLREMTEIYDAIGRHDENAARLAAIRHIQFASKAAKAAYQGE